MYFDSRNLHSVCNLFLYWFLHLWSWTFHFSGSTTTDAALLPNCNTTHQITTRMNAHNPYSSRVLELCGESSFSQGYGLSISDTLVARFFVCWHNGSLCQSDLMNDLSAQTHQKEECCGNICCCCYYYYHCCGCCCCCCCECARQYLYICVKRPANEFL